MSEHLAEVTRTAESAREAITARDAAIRAARTHHTLRQIAAAAGLTHPGVKKIIEREVTMTTTTSIPTGAWQIHTAELADGFYALINGGDHDEQPDTLVRELMRELRAEVDAALPEGWSWQPGTDEILHPVDSADSPDVASIFRAACDTVVARLDEIESRALS